ncbi:MAG: PEP-CTERM sorting domain-containing protein [Candidatus Competibacterales bacterium]
MNRTAAALLLLYGAQATAATAPPVPVPLPNTLLLVALGVAGLISLIARNRHK